MNNAIIRPIITETSMKDAASGKFTFLIDKKATKIDVKVAVEKQYNVKVKGVSTVSITRQKTVFTKYGRKKVKTDIKKARVKLEKGQKIAAFDIPEEKGKKEEEAK